MTEFTLSPTSNLIGRTADLDQLTEMVKAGKSVALTNPMSIGKTSLLRGLRDRLEIEQHYALSDVDAMIFGMDDNLDELIQDLKAWLDEDRAERGVVGPAVLFISEFNAFQSAPFAADLYCRLKQMVEQDGCQLVTDQRQTIADMRAWGAQQGLPDLFDYLTEYRVSGLADEPDALGWSTIDCWLWRGDGPLDLEYGKLSILLAGRNPRLLNRAASAFEDKKYGYSDSQAFKNFWYSVDQDLDDMWLRFPAYHKTLILAAIDRTVVTAGGQGWIKEHEYFVPNYQRKLAELVEWGVMEHNKDGEITFGSVAFWWWILTEKIGFRGEKLGESQYNMKRLNWPMAYMRVMKLIHDYTPYELRQDSGEMDILGNS